LKRVFGKYVSQFAGNSQQDSQEFISFLIDGLQEDLNQVHIKETFTPSDDLLPDE
jgi:ubiquitin carboxyl-terminal hydrolase 4/11/15